MVELFNSTGRDFDSTVKVAFDVKQVGFTAAVGSLLTAVEYTEKSRISSQVAQVKGPGKRGHIVADTLLPTQMFPRLPARATFVADTNFVSATNVSQFAQPKKHHGQQCVRNNVSSFTRALSMWVNMDIHSSTLIDLERSRLNNFYKNNNTFETKFTRHVSVVQRPS